MSRGVRRRRRAGAMVEGAGRDAADRDRKRDSVRARGAGAYVPRLVCSRPKHPVDPKQPRLMRSLTFSLCWRGDARCARADTGRPDQGHRAGLTARSRTCAVRRWPLTAVQPRSCSREQVSAGVPDAQTRQNRDTRTVSVSFLSGRGPIGKGRCRKSGQTPSRVWIGPRVGHAGHAPAMARATA
jgi:hypothetical protein